MSHNKVKVANQSPDFSGNISIDISNLSGPSYCFSSRVIPVQGGQLNVENGKFYFDNTLTESEVFIVPKNINESDQATDLLTRIILR